MRLGYNKGLNKFGYMLGHPMYLIIHKCLYIVFM